MIFLPTSSCPRSKSDLAAASTAWRSLIRCSTSVNACPALSRLACAARRCASNCGDDTRPTACPALTSLPSLTVALGPRKRKESGRSLLTRINQKSSAQLEPHCRFGSIARADAGGLDYRTPLVAFRLKQRSERFGRRAFDNDAE